MTKRIVFISYCREDCEAVAELRDHLIAHGFDVWWDQETPGGQDWRLEVRELLKKCDRFVICFSETTDNREYSEIYPELLDAIGVFRSKTPGSTFIYPVRLSECSVPSVEIDATRTLDRLQTVDLFPEERREVGLQQLVAALSGSSGSAGKRGPEAGTGRPRHAAGRTFVQENLKWAWLGGGVLAVVLAIMAVAYLSKSQNTFDFDAGGDIKNNIIIPGDKNFIIPESVVKPDFVTRHDGAGAMLMKEPDFPAFLAATVGTSNDKTIGRLINGTEVAYIDEHPGKPGESPPWVKIQVLDGRFKDQVGWILMSCLDQPY